MRLCCRDAIFARIKKWVIKTKKCIKKLCQLFDGYLSSLDSIRLLSEMIVISGFKFSNVTARWYLDKTICSPHCFVNLSFSLVSHCGQEIALSQLFQITHILCVNYFLSLSVIKWRVNLVILLVRLLFSQCIHTLIPSNRPSDSSFKHWEYYPDPPKT